MRVAVRLGAVDEYELAAVAAHDFRSGGVANTSTPNYVYRWSEREIEKTVASFAPHARHRIRFFREFELPEALVEIDRGNRAGVLRLARPVVTGITRVLPRQANLFAFAIEKPRLPADLQPWMRADGDELLPDPEVVGRRYGDGAAAPRPPPAGLGPPGRGGRALGGADARRDARAAAGTWTSSSRPARTRSRTSLRLPTRSAGRPRGAGARLRLRRRPADPCPLHPLRARARDRHLDGDGRAGAESERGLRRLRVPRQRRPRPGAAGAGSFDFVYSSIALQHLPTEAEIERYVTEFLRVVRADGLVVFGLTYTSRRSGRSSRADACTRCCAGSACRSSGCCGERR